MTLKTCVTPGGGFAVGIHEPGFHVSNFRETDPVAALGACDDGTDVRNIANFPPGDVTEPHADAIFEIANPFPFRGATFIIKRSADRLAEDPWAISLPERPAVSLSEAVRTWLGEDISPARLDTLFGILPSPVLLALAANGTDPGDLVRIARHCCEFETDPETGRPTGLRYERDPQGKPSARILDPTLHEVLANNIHLPEDYREVMVLRPGAQGSSEIVGEVRADGGRTHIFEYLRRNSYIPWGHYAANMANDAARYRACDLSQKDIVGMRHLYYQRTYARVAEELGIAVPAGRKTMSVEDLERLRREILDALSSPENRERLDFTATLWGWNFGFDLSPSGYRLHASHQQVHQQYAMIPGAFSRVETTASAGAGDAGGRLPDTFAFGDLIADFTARFKHRHHIDFFSAYLRAIQNNRRLDGRTDRPESLIVHQDEAVLLFAPKAQTSPWELQLMTRRPVGHILEADPGTRASLDRAMWIAVTVLERMGARMITTFEGSRRFDSADTDQRLLYCFLPKLPYSPGSFTEAQLRWINGHYPEDFAEACRRRGAGLGTGG
ncbi:hypothetical protein [Desulfococcus sp.]|uniref:hypothetical protein n=1 Tax=Desulfococcus sp. TaxID=2025834 RepID=UPI0035944FB8